MAAKKLLGKPVADRVQAEVSARVAALKERGKDVGLATVMVGDNPASEVYLGTKHKRAEEAGIQSFGHHLTGVAVDEVVALVESLNTDERVDGMIVQLPLPDGMDENRAIDAIDPAKDADGLHPQNLGLLAQGRPGMVPATPQGIAEMLDFYDVQVNGKTVVIVGRSQLVGRPLGLLLNRRGADATVVQAHSRTEDLQEVCRWGEVLVAAVGAPGLITADYVRPGAVVIDVGINRTEGGLVGDVGEGVAEVASALTPVPGGVGPMTVACLLRNTVSAAEATAGVT